MAAKYLPALLCLGSLFLQQAKADYGLQTTDKDYVVDTGAGLIVTVNRRNGDISQLNWNGVNMSIAKGSHIKSGIGTCNVTARTLPEKNLIMITAEVPAEDGSENPYSGLIHYYIFRQNQPTVYMATYIANRFGEMRWITRLDAEKFKQLQDGSDNRGTIGAMESKDVFKLPNGESRSKYYGNQRAKELGMRGISGPGVGVYMAYGPRESSSGGPFFRDIQNQTAEVYNYMFSGHNQTEPMRVGLHGPYALLFTKGDMPKYPDLSFMKDLEIKGWIKERGYLTGQTSGTLPGLPITVGWANADAQYWADGPTFKSPAMKPGTYTQTLYQGELAVATKKVTVTTGRTVQSDIAAPAPQPAPLWRIGVWDGTPNEFANGTTFNLRHPSDPRNGPWPKIYVVGKDQPANFPAAQWADVNSPLEIAFFLKPSEVKSRILTIAITASYTRARPFIELNDWKSQVQNPSGQPDSRSLTIGTYRGNNTNFEFKIPASALKTGTNKLRISVTGRGGFGKFLSPGYAFDCVEMN